MNDASLRPTDSVPPDSSAPAPSSAHRSLATWSETLPDLLGMPMGTAVRPSAFVRQVLVIVLYVAAARLMMLDPW